MLYEVITGFSNLLVEGELDDDRKSRYLAYVNNSSESLTTLINDIIDISKIEAGQLELRITSYNVCYTKLLRSGIRKAQPA